MTRRPDTSAIANEISDRIEHLMWSDEDGFYFDLALDGRMGSVKTIAAFWTLLAGVASEEHAGRLVERLADPATFGRHHRVPSLSGDDDRFSAVGDYWRGSVWAPTNTMVIRGLQHYGFEVART